MALSTDNKDLTVGLTASDLKVKLYDGSEVTLQKFTAEPIDGVKPNSVLCRRPEHDAHAHILKYFMIFFRPDNMRGMYSGGTALGRTPY